MLSHDFSGPLVSAELLPPKHFWFLSDQLNWSHISLGSDHCGSEYLVFYTAGFLPFSRSLKIASSALFLYLAHIGTVFINVNQLSCFLFVTQVLWVLARGHQIVSTGMIYTWSPPSFQTIFLAPPDLHMLAFFPVPLWCGPFTHTNNLKKSTYYHRPPNN